MITRANTGDIWSTPCVHRSGIASMGGEYTPTVHCLGVERDFLRVVEAGERGDGTGCVASG